MAIKKLAMTKEGAILSIIRNQIGKLSDGKKEFGIELEIVEYK